MIALKVARKFDFISLLKNLPPMVVLGILLYCYLIASLDVLNFLNTWFWNPFWTIGVLFGALVVDLTSGIVLSFKNGENFSTRKFKIWIFTAAGFFFILGVTFNFARVNDVMGWPPLSPILILISKMFYLLILMNTLASSGKNLAAAGIINGPIALLFIKYVDTYKKRATKIMEDQIKEIER